ncbi:MAG: hypothetical protein JOZ33_04580 [Acidobacteriaceae bacterium]|nr:hypothetical protein [Acidobacteriaceae bacterium]
MSVFFERFVLALLATSFFTLVIMNPLKFDAIQRVFLGIAIVALAIFSARFVSKAKSNPANQPPNTTMPTSAPAPNIQVDKSGSATAGSGGTANSGAITGSTVTRDRKPDTKPRDKRPTK